MLNSAVTGMMVRGVGYAPNAGRSESGPVVSATDVAAVKQLVNELSHAMRHAKAQAARNLSEKLKVLHDKAGGGTFKNDLHKLVQTLEGYVASLTAAHQPPQQVFTHARDLPQPRTKRDLGQQRYSFNQPTLRGPQYTNHRAYSEPVSRYDYYTDTRNPDRRPGVGNEYGNIWSGFYQGPSKGNCVTVAAIKAAMMRFGQKPTDIFNHVKAAGDGYNVEMRDGFRLHLSHNELAQAAYRADFRGHDSAMLADAHFLYAASAKRAQLENNDGYASAEFGQAMFSLNDGEDGYEGMQRLGLNAYIRVTTVQNLASGQIGAVTHGVQIGDQVFGHSLAVINGREDVWGKQGGYPPTNIYANALALV